MRLLVSVRSAEEVAAALSGGAEVIDAKEPARGSLGPVDSATLAAILARVPPSHPFSLALGDPATPERVAAALRGLPLPPRPGPSYVKLGFAGPGSGARIETLLTAAIAAARTEPGAPEVIAVAYADARRVGAPAPDAVCLAAARSGVRGVLLDTAVKDGSTLFDHMGPEVVARWVAMARPAGLLTAIAGALRIDDLAAARHVGADLVGVRGAACEGGREGRVAARLVAALTARLNSADEPEDSVQAPAA